MVDRLLHQKQSQPADGPLLNRLRGVDLALPIELGIEGRSVVFQLQNQGRFALKLPMEKGQPEMQCCLGLVAICRCIANHIRQQLLGGEPELVESWA